MKSSSLSVSTKLLFAELWRVSGSISGCSKLEFMPDPRSNSVPDAASTPDPDSSPDENKTLGLPTKVFLITGTILWGRNLLASWGILNSGPCSSMQFAEARSGLHRTHLYLAFSTGAPCAKFPMRMLADSMNILMFSLERGAVLRCIFPHNSSSLHTTFN